MTVNTAQVSGRRQLHFADFAELIADAERVATVPCQTLGNWSVAQVLDHLASAANRPFDGYGDFKVSWFTRYLIIPFLKNNLLTKQMPPGIQFPQGAKELLPSVDVTPQEALAKLKLGLARFSNELPTHPHPALGALALQEWVAFSLRHAEMHLSFVIPQA